MSIASKTVDMISFRTAFRSVIRRPQQNIAVIFGIALGVSLFVGVQVGSDSLQGGLNELTIRAIGERDAAISPSLTPFIFTEDVLNEELNATGFFPPLPFDTTPLIDRVMETDAYDDYVKASTQRLSLISTVLQPTTGAIEVGIRVTGIERDQDINFGELFTEDNTTILIDDLEDHEVYIGEETAVALFGEDNPIGENLTIQTTLFTQSQPAFNITSIAVPLSINVTIKDVFVDQGLGGELFSNYIISPFDVLQQQVVEAYTIAKFAAAAQFQLALGYGSAPLTSIFIIWNDDIEIGEESETAMNALTDDLEGIVGELYIQLFSVSDTRASLQEQIELATDSLELLLNGFGAIIILAGVLIIVNIQSMALSARERETGVMRAVGAKRGQIIRSNLFESVFLGIFGSFIGLFGGIAYGRLLVVFLSVAFEFSSDLFPVVIRTDTMLSSFFAGFVLSQLTGLFPAINASRINIARVLRGIDAPVSESFSRNLLYVGLLLSAGAFATLISLDPNPLLDGNEAFKSIEDVQTSYLPIVFLIMGPAILLAYFRNYRLGLSAAGLGLLGWAYFNIFYVLDQIEVSSSETNGLAYILFLAGSLLIGTVIVMAVNLSALATIGQGLFRGMAGAREIPIRGTTMVAFRKMRSKVNRSTLTFAMFATILTLNIWIGTFSYSFRFGLDEQTQVLTGESDLVLFTPDNAIPITVEYSQQLLDEFSNQSREIRITETRGFLASQNAPLYYNGTDLSGADTLITNSAFGISVRPDSFWESEAQENWIFPFDLDGNKTGTPFETFEDEEAFSIEVTAEDEAVWKAIANNESIPNKNGELRPVIASTFIFSFSEAGFEPGPVQGESVFLNLTDGSLQEFVIGAVSNGAPLSDYQNAGGPGGGGFGGPGGGFSTSIYVSEFWKNELLAFSGLAETENVFLAKTNLETSDDELEPFLLEIEQWSNAGGFREANEDSLYGIVGLTTYSIYQEQLEAGFQFFQFLQAFVSLGFAVGILGLLVVASRSVAERKREIGMLRALGFRRRDIVVSVVLELIVLGLIGLFLGFINGVVMGYALTTVFGGSVQFQIPWGTVVIYGLITVFSALFAAVIPAIRASQIPASDALRYTG